MNQAITSKNKEAAKKFVEGLEAKGEAKMSIISTRPGQRFDLRATAVKYGVTKFGGGSYGIVIASSAGNEAYTCSRADDVGRILSEALDRAALVAGKGD